MLAILLLAGCAPRIQEFSAPVTPPEIYEDRLVTGSGITLPVRYWLPPAGTGLEAVIVALHGFNDYSNAFIGPGYYLRGKGIGMYAYDQRGFGDTAERGIWAGETNLKTDLRQMVLAVKARHPDVPVFVLGESMGGAVAITALAEPDFPPVAGVILSAPAVWGSDTMNPFYRGGLWAVAHTIPWKTVTGKGLRILASDNFEMLRALGKDPLIIKKTRLDAIYGIVQLMDDAYAQAEQVKVPLLMLYGMNDQVIPPRPILDVTNRLTMRYKLAYYPRGYHLLLRDLKSELVLNDIAAWIKNTDGFLPSGYDLGWREFFPNPDNVSME